MTVQKGRITKYVLTMLTVMAAALLLNVSHAQAAVKLALFNFAAASDLKVEKGAKLDLAGDTQASGWTSSNPKVVKVTKKGVATALKAGKAVISANIDGETKECQVTVVKDVVKASKYLAKVSRTWENEDSKKKVTVKSGNLKKGLGDLLLQVKTENADDVVYQKCSKITAVEEDSAGATVYFEAVGTLDGKQASYPCVAVFTNDYEHEQYQYALMLQQVVWVTDDGKLLYGAGSFWYA
ncbi:MAG: hypothetical protein K2N87_13605 [Eubacterium sp.]|nr:hypothetical protein [Eubacterium sp.]